jgi:long-chain acyl-CoA synthetase
VEIKIASDGEILARGPNIMQGYYKNKKETDATIKDGWLYTGDIGVFDGDGF